MSADETLRERLAEALDDVLPEAGWLREGLFEDVFARVLPLIHAERDKARAEVVEREWAERFLVAWSAPYFGPDPQDAVAAVQRAARAALTEADDGARS